VGSVDAFVFLIAGILNTIFLGLDIRALYEGTPFKFPFYIGWANDHTDWTPPHVPYSVVATQGPDAAWILSVYYINEWTPVVVGFSVFALFGTTHEARRLYSRPFRFVASALGWQPTIPHRPQLSSVKFTPPFNSSCSTNGEQRSVILDGMLMTTFLTRSLFSFLHRSCSGSDGVLVECSGDDSEQSQGSLKNENKLRYA
jgi:hypothetical protein